MRLLASFLLYTTIGLAMLVLLFGIALCWPRTFDVNQVGIQQLEVTERGLTMNAIVLESGMRLRTHEAVWEGGNLLIRLKGGMLFGVDDPMRVEITDLPENLQAVYLEGSESGRRMQIWEKANE